MSLSGSEQNDENGRSVVMPERLYYLLICYKVEPACSANSIRVH